MVRSILQQRAVVGSDVVQHATASGAVRHLWSSERLRGFYRGLVPHILRAAPTGVRPSPRRAHDTPPDVSRRRAAPTASVTLVSYEYLHRLLVSHAIGAAHEERVMFTMRFDMRAPEFGAAARDRALLRVEQRPRLAPLVPAPPVLLRLIRLPSAIH